MQPATRNSLLLIYDPFLRVLSGLPTAGGHELYRQISKRLIEGIQTKQVFISLGDRLITLAEQAYDLRQFDVIQQVSQVLLNWPSSEYKNLGFYYQALCLRQEGRLTESLSLLERLAEELPPKFRAKSLLAMSAIFYRSSDFQSFLVFCVEANRAATYHDSFDVQAMVTAQRNIALYKSIDGDHRGAVDVLERLLPLAHTVGKWHPYLYFEHLNSLAVELTEVGRLEEAQNVSRIALASPYASAYPEWGETWADIQVRRYRTSRSVLSLNHSALNIGNVLPLILPERTDDTGSDKSYRSPFQQQGSVTVLKEWIEEKMVKEPNDTPLTPLTRDQILKLSRSEKRVRVVDLVYEDDVSEETLTKILEVAEDMVRKDKAKDSS